MISIFRVKTVGLLTALVASTAGYAFAEPNCEIRSGNGRDSKLILFSQDLRPDDSYGIQSGGRNFSVGYAICDGQYTKILGQRINREGNMTLAVDGSFRRCQVDRSRNWQTVSFSCVARHGGGGGHDRRVDVPMLAMKNAAAGEKPFNLGWDQWNWYMNERVVGHTYLTNSSVLAPETYGLKRRPDGKIIGFERGMRLETWCSYLQSVVNCY